MMYECIRDSLTNEGIKRVNIWKNEYTVQEMISGPLILKTVLRESHIDTKSTSTAIRKKLSNLNTHIDTVGHFITKFNAHVKALIQLLLEMRDMSTDLLANIFKGYTMCLDQ